MEIVRWTYKLAISATTVIERNRISAARRSRNVSRRVRRLYLVLWFLLGSFHVSSRFFQKARLWALYQFEMKKTLLHRAVSCSNSLKMCVFKQKKMSSLRPDVSRNRRRSRDDILTVSSRVFSKARLVSKLENANPEIEWARVGWLIIDESSANGGNSDLNQIIARTQNDPLFWKPKRFCSPDSFQVSPQKRLFGRCSSENPLQKFSLKRITRKLSFKRKVCCFKI